MTDSNHEQANHDPYDDDDDQEPEFEADLPEPEATQTPVPDILQYDQPGAVLTAEVARARHLKMEILRATIWKQIAMKEVPQVHKYVEVSITNRAENARKLSGIAVRQQKRWVQRPYATAKENQARGRKAARDVGHYYTAFRCDYLRPLCSLRRPQPIGNVMRRTRSNNVNGLKRKLLKRPKLKKRLEKRLELPNDCSSCLIAVRRTAN